MAVILKEVDKVEIRTLQDNYIDLVSGDDTEMLKRAMPVKGMEVKNSILAEHGFSTLVTVTEGDISQNILFDFGFSEHGAAFNAEALDLDLTVVASLVLSHGHVDHTGGIEQLAERVEKKGIELVVHPGAFKSPRYIKTPQGIKIFFPVFTREKLENAGIRPIESKDPYLLLNDTVLFLGEVPRKTEFEKGLPNFFYEENGEEKHDAIEDDTAIVLNVIDKGLVILSGCAHAGIINTVRYAKELTGVDRIYAIMGGFHLTGPEADLLIELTIEALLDINPVYIIPTHCTGRTAIMRIEEAMPDNFLLNMSGTKLIFS